MFVIAILNFIVKVNMSHINLMGDTAVCGQSELSWIVTESMTVLMAQKLLFVWQRLTTA